MLKVESENVKTACPACKLVAEGNGWSPEGHVRRSKGLMDYLYGTGGSDLIQSVDDVGPARNKMANEKRKKEDKAV